MIDAELKQYIDAAIAVQVQAALGLHCDAPAKPQKLPVLVRELLQGLGMSIRLRGFELCADAICRTVIEPNVIHTMTKVLYPDVADARGTTQSGAERAIRHAIERMYDYSGESRSDWPFSVGYSPDSGKPTNSEFIAAVARYIRDCCEYEN